MRLTEKANQPHRSNPGGTVSEMRLLCQLREAIGFHDSTFCFAFDLTADDLVQWRRAEGQIFTLDSSPIFIAKDFPSSNEMTLTSFKIDAFETRIRQRSELPSRGQTA